MRRFSEWDAPEDDDPPRVWDDDDAKTLEIEAEDMQHLQDILRENENNADSDRST